MIANVVHVEAYPLLIGKVAAPADLPEAGETRLDGRQVMLPFAELLQLRQRDHTRPDQAHLAAQDIEELWQFIQAVASQKRADTRHTWVVLQLAVIDQFTLLLGCEQLVA